MNFKVPWPSGPCVHAPGAGSLIRRWRLVQPHLLSCTPSGPAKAWHTAARSILPAGKTGQHAAACRRRGSVLAPSPTCVRTQGPCCLLLSAALLTSCASLRAPSVHVCPAASWSKASALAPRTSCEASCAPGCSAPPSSRTRSASLGAEASAAPARMRNASCQRCGGRGRRCPWMGCERGWSGAVVCSCTLVLVLCRCPLLVALGARGPGRGRIVFEDIACADMDTRMHHQ